MRKWGNGTARVGVKEGSGVYCCMCKVAKAVFSYKGSIGL